MTELATPTIAPPASRTSTLWRVAGGLALAHVVMLFAGFSQEVVVEHATSLDTIMQKYGDADLNRVLTGGYIEAMSFIVLVVAVVLIGRLFGSVTEVAKIAGQAFVALGIVFAATTLAVGFAPGASAVYWSQHDGTAQLVGAINDIRNYGFVIQVAISLAMAGALACAALSRKIFAVWVGWFGLVLGTLGVAVAALVPNAMSMAQLIWWVGLAVLCLRGGPKTS